MTEKEEHNELVAWSLRSVARGAVLFEVVMQYMYLLAGRVLAYSTNHEFP
jgi:hypothetical protein